MTIEERNQLIEENIKLAPYAARMYRNMLPNHDLDDIISIANMAMVRATPSYSPQKGTYANYITLCIFRAINHVAGETAGDTRTLYPVSIDNQTTDNPDYSPHTFHEFIGSKYDYRRTGDPQCDGRRNVIGIITKVQGNRETLLSR